MKKQKKFTKAILNWSHRASNRLNGKRTTQSYSNGVCYHLLYKRKKMLRIFKMKSGTLWATWCLAGPPSSVRNGGVSFKKSLAWKAPGLLRRPQFWTKSRRSSKSTTVKSRISQESGSKFLPNLMPRLGSTERPECAAKSGSLLLTQIEWRKPNSVTTRTWRSLNCGWSLEVNGTKSASILVGERSCR